LIFVTAGSVDVAFLPSRTTCTVTPRLCAASSASATPSMLMEWMAPRMEPPAGVALMRRLSSSVMV